MILTSAALTLQFHHRLAPAGRIRRMVANRAEALERVSHQGEESSVVVSARLIPGTSSQIADAAEYRFLSSGGRRSGSDAVPDRGVRR